MANEIQGYLAIIPNSPDGRGMLYFTKEAAIGYKEKFDKAVETDWNIEWKFNKDYWKEKPLPVEFYTLGIKDKVYG